jgi:hypothetical protein
MRVLALACLLAMSIPTVSFGAIGTDGDLSIKLSFSTACSDGDVLCVGPVKATFKGTHVINIDDAEAALFSDTTSVTVYFLGSTPVPMLLGDDPQYQTGDTSAKIKKSVDLNLFGGDGVKMDISAQLNWSSGDMIVKVTAKVTGDIEQPAPTFLTKSHVKDAAPQSLQTVVENPGPATVFDVTTGLICDTKTVETNIRQAEGNATVTATISVKSQFLD